MKKTALLGPMGWSRAFAVSLAVASLSVACSGGDDETGRNTIGSGTGTGGSGPLGGTGATGSGTGGVDLGTGTGTDPDRDLPIREEVCDTQGNCTCLKVALLGTLDSAADDTDTQPFIDWLNGNSDGTAAVTMVNVKPTIDAAFLANYDILLVANVNGWVFSDAEKQAVATWSNDTGGGIIALTGFVSTATEAADTSQLISFSGINFQAPKSAEGGEGQPVYFQGGTENLKNCMNWTGGGKAYITTPIQFAPQTGTLEPLTASLDYVGAFIGWGLTAPADAVVVATDPMSGGNMAVAKEVNGKGRVFAFGDEWVIFANQWVPSGNPNNMQKDEYNPCYVPATGDKPEYFHSVQSLYQTKQFWYNAINWVAPPNECFTVTDTDVIVK